MNLEVVQTSFQWENDQVDDFVGFEFTINNIGVTDIEKVYIGFFADSDIGPRGEGGIADDDMAGSWPDHGSPAWSAPRTAASCPSRWATCTTRPRRAGSTATSASSSWATTSIPPGDYAPTQRGHADLPVLLRQRQLRAGRRSHQRRRALPAAERRRRGLGQRHPAGQAGRLPLPGLGRPVRAAAAR